MLNITVNTEKLSKFAAKYDLHVRYDGRFEIRNAKEFQAIFGCEYEHGDHGQVVSITFADGSKTVSPEDRLMGLDPSNTDEIQKILNYALFNPETGVGMVGYNVFSVLKNEQIIADQLARVIDLQ